MKCGICHLLIRRFNFQIFQSECKRSFYYNKTFLKQLFSIYLCYTFKKSKQIRFSLLMVSRFGARCLAKGQVSRNWANILITKPDDITIFFFFSFSYQISSIVTVELISFMFVFEFDISMHLLHWQRHMPDFRFKVKIKITPDNNV